MLIDLENKTFCGKITFKNKICSIIFSFRYDHEECIFISIPEFGETYEITSEEVKLTNKIERKVVRTLRDEISQRLTKLKPEIEEMEKYIREDIANENLRDEDIFRINEKIKDLEKQIANVVEG